MKFFTYSIFYASAVLISLSGCSQKDNIAQETSYTPEIKNETVSNTPPLCSLEPSPRRISGNSMEPLIKENETVFLLENFYSLCEKTPQKGDLVAYDYAGEKIPIIKTVVADSSHLIQIKNNTLWIDGIEEKNSAGSSYSFSAGEQKMIMISVTNGHIPKNSYLILGDNINNSRDSRKFGAIGLSDILGKFERK